MISVMETLLCPFGFEKYCQLMGAIETFDK